MHLIHEGEKGSTVMSLSLQERRHERYIVSLTQKLLEGLLRNLHMIVIPS